MPGKLEGKVALVTGALTLFKKNVVFLKTHKKTLIHVAHVLPRVIPNL